jgi:hypothetical protein
LSALGHARLTRWTGIGSAANCAKFAFQKLAARNKDCDMKKFDQRYPNARTGSGNASWPRGVHKISQIGLDNLGVDNEGRLYWNGQMIKEANPLELTYPQEVSAIIAIVSGVVLAVATLVLAVVDTARLFGYGHCG